MTTDPFSRVHARNIRRTPSESEHRIGVPLLVTIAILNMVASLGTDIFTPSFPEVVSQLNAPVSTVQMTLTMFMLGMGLGQLFWGPWSDHIGRRWPLLLACVIFVAASIGAPMANSIGVLITARVIQGFAGSAGAVLGRAVARDLASGATLAQVFSLLGVITAISPVVAPVIGGVLAGPIGWRGVLWVLTGIAVLMLLLTAVTVPESLPAESRHAGGAADVLASIQQVGADRVFLGYVLVQGLGMGCLYAFISSSSFVLQSQYGLGSLNYSLLFACNAVGMVAGGLANVWLVKHVDSRRILAFSLACSSVVTLLLCAVTAAAAAKSLTPPLVLAMALVWIISLLNGPVLATTTTLSLQRHPRNAGMASAVLGAVSFACSALVAQLVSVNGSANMASMTIVMCGSMLAAGGCYLLICRDAPPITEVTKLDL